ncbi:MULTISPECIES: UbiA family prenyltransferase [Streptomyces]|uniref:UbiA family prenyltransferase n=1 Tax=Streptomyces griseocarneus TaxID=51201 RepID=A0ABX7RMF0_9ACTN|nr:MULTISPECIES: UbiA family prenyltransferase [Streptomyces]QSY49382.1 UbiA family prenyltransferase [Streptomyces griseocarneus]
MTDDGLVGQPRYRARSEVLRRWWCGLWREVVLSWRFNVVDLSAAVVPGGLFAVAAWRSLHLPASDLAWVLGRSLVYFWLFLSVHTLSNQLVGVEEDRANKPYRPLPRGLVTVRGTTHRLVVVVVLFLLAGQIWGVLPWTVLWVVLVGVRTYENLMRWWFVKNPAIVAGAFALLGAAWKLAGPLTPAAWYWVVAGTAYWLIGFVEDLRDVPGDTTVGRRTLPVVLGAPVVRGAVGVALVLVPCATLWALEPNITAPVLIWLSVLALGCVLVTARLWVLRSPRQDALTYQLYCCVWCCLLCGPAFSV